MGFIKNKIAQNHLRQAGKQIAEVHRYLQDIQMAGLTEIKVAQLIQEKMDRLNVQGLAFPIIVGSGYRALDLHAMPSEKVITENDLVLIDIGVTYEGYCSDMTRTYCASKYMSQEQHHIIKIVQNVQRTVISSICTETTLFDMHQLAQSEFCRQLDLTDLKGQYELKKIYPHKTSHWIGEVVHEQSPYFDGQGVPLKLQAGMCFTVEPGLYIRDTGTIYDGLGVRIEDVILLTENGIEVLTAGSIEASMFPNPRCE